MFYSIMAYANNAKKEVISIEFPDKRMNLQTRRENIYSQTACICLQNAVK